MRTPAREDGAVGIERGPPSFAQTQKGQGPIFTTLVSSVLLDGFEPLDLSLRDITETLAGPLTIFFFYF